LICGGLSGLALVASARPFWVIPWAVWAAFLWFRWHLSRLPFEVGLEGQLLVLTLAAGVVRSHPTWADLSRTWGVYLAVGSFLPLPFGLLIRALRKRRAATAWIARR
jgi:hypothetical protein